MKPTTGASMTATIATVIGAVLAQFAPWLQTPAKAAIAGVAGLVVTWLTHEQHATVRAHVRSAPVAPPPGPAPVAVTEQVAQVSATPNHAVGAP